MRSTKSCKETDVSLNIHLLNQSQKHDPDNGPIVPNNLSDKFLSVTESHEIDTFDDISPLENVEEEVEDVGGTCNGNRIRFST